MPIDPQGDAEADEGGEGVVELVAVEGALRFAGHDGVECAVGVAEGWEEFVGAGAALPGQFGHQPHPGHVGPMTRTPESWRNGSVSSHRPALTLL
ncbi:hypothetical protein [Streptomyces sp. Ag109_O5-10]|uniref:hypothetical protein n=1 Tax=Streptomyces sp. Ag109_O5-10 TaxID=1855349 RepID=UPI00115F7DE6|nr:hypothetical protein [Streptomyces sp. Ag109_O5-10]